jgi:hypothetical protein
MSRESLRVYEKNILRKDEAIENLSKAFEKQREKNDLLRVMMEWKLKRQENAKEVCSNSYFYQNGLFIDYHFFIFSHLLKK